MSILVACSKGVTLMEKRTFEYQGELGKLVGYLKFNKVRFTFEMGISPSVFEWSCGIDVDCSW